MGLPEIVSFSILLVILILFSAIFSAAEVSYNSISKLDISRNLAKGKRSAKLIEKHYHRYGWTLATILIGNNLVNLAASSITTYLLASALSNSELVTLVATFSITPIVIIFGEYLPKVLAKRFPYKYLTTVVLLIEFLNWLFFPITFPLSRLALSTRITHSERDLHDLIGIASKEGVLERKEATLAQRALQLDSLQVESIMTKLKNISALDRGTTVGEARVAFASSGYSRMPVMGGNRFVGVILLKDILLAPDTDLIASYLKPPVYVSRHLILAHALETMRAAKTQIALVTGSRRSVKVEGLITIEDIVESLLGEIHDEHDHEEVVRQVAHHKWVVPGNVLLEDVSVATGISFPVRQKGLDLTTWFKRQTKKRLKKDLSFTWRNRYVFRIVENSKDGAPLIQIEERF